MSEKIYQQFEEFQDLVAQEGELRADEVAVLLWLLNKAICVRQSINKAGLKMRFIRHFGKQLTKIIPAENELNQWSYGMFAQILCDEKMEIDYRQNDGEIEQDKLEAVEYLASKAHLLEMNSAEYFYIVVAIGNVLSEVETMEMMGLGEQVLTVFEREEKYLSGRREEFAWVSPGNKLSKDPLWIMTQSLLGL